MGDFMKKMKEDPFANYLGITIEDVEEGYAKVSMEIKGNLLNFHGSANGGAIFLWLMLLLLVLAIHIIKRQLVSR